MSSFMSRLNSKLQRAVKQWVNEVSTSTDRTSGLGRLRMRAALALINLFAGRAVPFASRNRFRVIDFRPGYVRALIPLKGNANHFRGMYAGALFTVAELPGGIIAIFSFDDQSFPVLNDLKIDFIKMARSDVSVEFEISETELERIKEEVTRRGRCAFVLDGELRDAEGEIVARSHANYQVLKKR